MISRLKRKFILLTLSALVALLTIMALGMNIVNYTAVVNETDDILEILSHNKGTFPGFEGGMPGRPDGGGLGRLPGHMSPELPYESRYFSVLVENGRVVYADVSRIASVTAADATEYAERVLASSEDKGFSDEFRYIKCREGDKVRIIFLDCGRRLDSFYTFLWTSVSISLAGFALVAAVICILAGRIIRPIAESYEKQKRFITDAGHEIKTPLTVINANVDLLRIDQGESESLDDIQRETKKLAKLTENLVSLARMEEADGGLQMIEFPLSETVAEEAESFKAPLTASGRKLECRISDMISLRGDTDAVRRLMSILMENSLKYSSPESAVTVSLSKQGRGALLKVSNEVERPLTKDELAKIFDRFYRADPSRNSETGGHGIGLSMAKAIVSAHGGRISAAMENENIFSVSVIFPL